jgi:hypothetical protein
MFLRGALPGPQGGIEVASQALGGFPGLSQEACF